MRGSAGKPLPRLSNRAARKLFLDRHGLGRPPQGEDLAGLIERLGFVQIDSIATVERAHHMILASRRRKLPAATARRPAGTAARALRALDPRCVGHPHVVLSPLAAALPPRRRKCCLRAGGNGAGRGSRTASTTCWSASARAGLSWRANSAAAEGVTHPAGGTGIRRRRRWNSSGAPARSPSTGARGSRRSSTWPSA